MLLIGWFGHKDSCALYFLIEKEIDFVLVEIYNGYYEKLFIR